MMESKNGQPVTFPWASSIPLRNKIRMSSLDTECRQSAKATEEKYEDKWKMNRSILHHNNTTSY